MLLAMLVALLAATLTAPNRYLSLPAKSDYTKIVPGGVTVLPNGRLVTPTGKRLYTGEDLWFVAANPNGKQIVGIHDNGLSIYTDLDAERPVRKTLLLKDVAPACVFQPDGKTLYVSTGEAGGYVALDTVTYEVKARVALGSFKVEDGFLVDLALSPDGTRLFAADVANQKVYAFDTQTNQLVSEASGGRQPYALAVGDGGKDLFLANIGLFDYTMVPAPIAGQGNPRGLSRPPFGFPSSEAEMGVRFEGRDIAGLGSARVPDAQSVWKFQTEGQLSVTKRAKSGLLIHGVADAGKSVGGSAPNKLLADRGELFVSNANSDTVSVFDQRTLALKRTIRLSPSPLVSRLRGVIPSGLAIDRSGKRLYVAESGLSAVAVIDRPTGRVLGHIPTGWFPIQITMMPDGKKLAIGTQWGLGRGPRGAKHRRQASDERSAFPEMPGMIDLAPIPADAQLAGLTQRVLKNNGLVAGPTPKAANPIPFVPGKPSEQIKYVVFITKENHTFDGIFGGLKGSKSEPDYAEFGLQGWIEEKGKQERVPIMPNHIRLAERFAISDNFYMEPGASGAGHRWLVGNYASLWTSRLYYSGWNFKGSDKTKGRLVSFGSNGSQIPEDYLENGSLWEHLERGKVPFRNYGEGFEFAASDEGEPFSRSGTGEVVNFPMPKVLFDNTCFEFPAYNTNIPDVARVEWFKEDLAKYRVKNKGQLPRFINIAICNDHGASPRPDQGYPFVSSYMADNDLALGRIVDFLSHQPEWKKMAIFVTQDDAGGDDDSVDRHRSFVLAISPFAKRGYVSKEHTCIMSILRTIYLTFGMGPNNMFDAIATPLHDMFTTKPDFSPYRHVASDPRVFKPEDTFDPADPLFKKRWSLPSAKMDSDEFFEWLKKRKSGEPDRP
jgi:DNA-binding beta-propeller fold protein YncE